MLLKPPLKNPPFCLGGMYTKSPSLIGTTASAFPFSKYSFKLYSSVFSRLLRTSSARTTMIFSTSDSAVILAGITSSSVSPPRKPTGPGITAQAL